MSLLLASPPSTCVSETEESGNDLWLAAGFPIDEVRTETRKLVMAGACSLVVRRAKEMRGSQNEGNFIYPTPKSWKPPKLAFLKNWPGQQKARQSSSAIHSLESLAKIGHHSKGWEAQSSFLGSTGMLAKQPCLQAV